jgi:ketosteroid isomerase-like protein
MTNTTHNTSDPKIAAVQRLYAAYGRGDIEAATADLAEDVDWAAEAAGTGVPWWGPYHGKADVPRFFKEIGSNVDVKEFDVVSITSNETDVVAIVHWSYTVNATGKTATMYMQHWWRFVDGKIVFFRGSEDSAQSAAVFA